MLIVAPPFWSAAAGDHAPGDGLTRLQTAFAAGSAADVSSYAIGSGSLSGSSTLTDGSETFVLTNGVTNARQWTDAGLDIANSSASTWEILFNITAHSVQPPSLTKYAQITVGNISCDVDINGWTGVNDWSLVGTPGTSTGTEALSAAASYVHHAAFIWKTTGFVDVYIDGVRIILDQAYSHAGASGTIQIGGVGPGVQSITFKFLGVRCRRAVMYGPGATITPPANAAAWGPP